MAPTMRRDSPIRLQICLPAHSDEAAASSLLGRAVSEDHALFVFLQIGWVVLLC